MGARSMSSRLVRRGSSELSLPRMDWLRGWKRKVHVQLMMDEMAMFWTSTWTPRAVRLDPI